jgi:hypothetical protein
VATYVDIEIAGIAHARQSSYIVSNNPLVMLIPFSESRRSAFFATAAAV